MSHALHKVRQRFYGLRGLRNTRHLSLRRLRQFGGAVEHTAGGIGHLHRCILYTANNLCQFFDHVVKRVRQHTQRIRCHLGLHPQVAIADRAHLLQQFLNLRLQGCGIAQTGDSRRNATGAR